MDRKIIISGVGGQGVMSLGQNIISAGMLEGKKVTYIPTYGPEMRGGFATVEIVISDNKIGSPIIENPDELIAMNDTAFYDYIDKVKENGIVFYNGENLPNTDRSDVKIISIPSDLYATKLGNPKVANMIVLGTYIELTKLFKTETIEKLIYDMFGEKKPELVDLNIKALNKGIEIGKNK